MKTNRYIRMFANCIPVRGAHKSAIYDLQRKQAIDIPNDLFDFILLFKKHSVTEIFELCGAQNSAIVDEYFHFLIKEELAFFLNKEELPLFPELDLHWDCPSLITNAILEISEITLPHCSKMIKSVEALGCEHIYIKIHLKDSLTVLQQLLDSVAGTAIYGVTVELKYELKDHISDVEALVAIHKRIDTIYLLSEEKVDTESKKILVVSPKHFVDRKEFFFNVNMNLFTEAQQHNTYFNRKLYINRQGTIKNAPETETTFGTIQEISIGQLKEIVGSKPFQTYWKIHKDVIPECRDCEFRYMCVDNRVPIASNDGEYYFSTPCAVKYQSAAKVLSDEKS